MKKIAMGMLSFLFIALFLASSVVCGYAAVEAKSNIEITNNYGNEITVKVDEYKILIVNNTYKALDNVEIKMEGNKVKFSHFIGNIDGFESVEIDLQDYYSQEFLEKNDVNVKVTKVWFSYILLGLFVGFFSVILTLYISKSR